MLSFFVVVVYLNRTVEMGEMDGEDGENSNFATVCARKPNRKCSQSSREWGSFTIVQTAPIRTRRWAQRYDGSDDGVCSYIIRLIAANPDALNSTETNGMVKDRSADRLSQQTTTNYLFVAGLLQTWKRKIQ